MRATRTNDSKKNFPETSLPLSLGSKMPGKWHLTRVGKCGLQRGVCVCVGPGDRHCRGARPNSSALTYPGLSSGEDTLRLFNLVWLSGRMLALGDRVSLCQLPLLHL